MRTAALLPLLAILVACPQTDPVDTVDVGDDTGDPIDDTGVDTDTEDEPVDADGDGYTSDEDCNDNDPSVHPNAEEICNDVDDDCYGGTDNGLHRDNWYTDADGDGFGGPGSVVSDCAQPPNTIADGTDCDDSSAAVNPDAVEVCGNGIDDNCDGGPNACGGFSSDVPRTAATLSGSGYKLGDTVAAGGDLDGDGKPDLVVASNYGGKVYIFDGDSPSLDAADAKAVLSSDQSSDRFGSSIAVVPDIDGDGSDELLIGARKGDGDIDIFGWPPDSGVVYLMTGPFDTDRQVISDETQTRWAGATQEDQLGASVDVIGDFNGDGEVDFVFGGPDYDGNSSGAGYVVLGPHSGEVDIGDGFFLRGRAVNPPEGFHYGDDAGDAVAGVGDVDGDGLADVLVGAPMALDPDIFCSNCTNGSAYLFLGGTSGDISLADADANLEGDYDADVRKIGAAMDGADFDGDGKADIALGAPQYDGGAFVVLSTPSGDFDVATQAEVALPGEAGGNGWSGKTIAAGGDVDGDGVPDLAVGAPGLDVGAIDTAGRIYLVSGASLTAGTHNLAGMPSIHGTENYDEVGGFNASNWSGFMLTFAPDVDGDGYDEILTGTGGDNALLFRGGAGL